MPKQKRKPQPKEQPVDPQKILKRRQKLRSVEGLNWKTYLINNKHYARISYGQETHIATEESSCITCEVKKGQFHLLGCDLEGCPACGRQTINCDCESFKEDDTENS